MDEDKKRELIDSYRYINVEWEWWDSVWDDFHMICSIMGVELDEGEPRFSGFCSQGDGASFAGRYRSFKLRGYGDNPPVLLYETAPTKIREYAPKDEELHRIADELCMLSRIYFPIHISITRFGGSHYAHEQTMDCYVEPMEGDPDDWAEEVHAHVQHEGTVLMRDLARWLYRTLEDEYDYLTSDEAVWDTIEANELCEAHNEGEQ